MIDRIGPVGPAGSSGGPGRARFVARSEPRAPDSVELSQSARLAGVLAARIASGEVRSAERDERLAGIAREVGQGSYATEEKARSALDELLGELADIDLP